METVEPPGFPLNVVFGTQLSSSPEGLSVFTLQADSLPPEPPGSPYILG